MGQCFGVCIGDISPPEYKKHVVAPLIMFLKGGKKRVISTLTKRMKRAAKEKNYEQALTILESIVSDDADNINVISEIADCYIQMENFDLASEFLSSLSSQILNNEKIKQLKSNGLKTEPAFAQLLGLKGNPYAELLKLEINTLE